MNALLMCGGRGSRLRPAVGDAEKPLVAVGGVPMVERVLAALRESRVETVAAAVSPATPETADRLRKVGGLTLIETPGKGYVEDLETALDRIGSPAVTVTADLPLLATDHVDRAIDVAAGDSLAVCVPEQLIERVGVSADTTFEHDGRTVVPTGLNVVGDGADRIAVWSDRRLAFNVNRPGDLAAVERHLDRSR